MKDDESTFNSKRQKGGAFKKRKGGVKIRERRKEGERKSHAEVKKTANLHDFQEQGERVALAEGV